MEAASGPRPTAGSPPLDIPSLRRGVPKDVKPRVASLLPNLGQMPVGPRGLWHDNDVVGSGGGRHLGLALDRVVKNPAADAAARAKRSETIYAGAKMTSRGVADASTSGPSMNKSPYLVHDRVPSQGRRKRETPRERRERRHASQWRGSPSGPAAARAAAARLARSEMDAFMDVLADGSRTDRPRAHADTGDVSGAVGPGGAATARAHTSRLANRRPAPLRVDDEAAESAVHRLPSDFGQLAHPHPSVAHLIASDEHHLAKQHGPIITPRTAARVDGIVPMSPRVMLTRSQVRYADGRYFYDEHADDSIADERKRSPAERRAGGGLLAAAHSISVSRDNLMVHDDGQLSRETSSSGLRSERSLGQLREHEGLHDRRGPVGRSRSNIELQQSASRRAVDIALERTISTLEVFSSLARKGSSFDLITPAASQPGSRQISPSTSQSDVTTASPVRKKRREKSNEDVSAGGDDAGKMKKSRSTARLSKSPSVARLAAHVPRVARLAQREKPPEKMTPEQIWQEAMQKSQQPIAPELVRLSANAAKVEERQMPLFVELARFIEQKYLDQYEAEQAADQAASEAAQRAAEAERARKQAEAEGKTVDEKDGKDDGKGSGAKAIAPSAPQRRAIAAYVAYSEYRAADDYDEVNEQLTRRVAAVLKLYKDHKKLRLFAQLTGLVPAPQGSEQRATAAGNQFFLRVWNELFRAPGSKTTVGGRSTATYHQAALVVHKVFSGVPHDAVVRLVHSFADMSFAAPDADLEEEETVGLIALTAIFVHLELHGTTLASLLGKHDTEGAGFVTRAQFQAAVASIGVVLSENRVKAAIAVVGGTPDGNVSFEALDEEGLLLLCDDIFVDVDEIVTRVMDVYAVQMRWCDSQTRYIFEMADMNSDGFLSLGEFRKIMSFFEPGLNASRLFGAPHKGLMSPCAWMTWNRTHMYAYVHPPNPRAKPLREVVSKLPLLQKLLKADHDQASASNVPTIAQVRVGKDWHERIARHTHLARASLHPPTVREESLAMPRGLDAEAAEALEILLDKQIEAMMDATRRGGPAKLQALVKEVGITPMAQAVTEASNVEWSNAIRDYEAARMPESVLGKYMSKWEEREVIAEHKIVATIVQIFSEKAVVDATMKEAIEYGAEQRSHPTPLNQFVIDFMLKQYGLPVIMDKHMVKFIANVIHYSDVNATVRMFARLCGLFEPYNVSCQEYFIDAVAALNRSIKDSTTSKAKKSTFRGGDKIAAERRWVSQTNASEIVGELLCGLPEDMQAGLVRQIEQLVVPSQDAKKKQALAGNRGEVVLTHLLERMRETGSDFATLAAVLDLKEGEGMDREDMGKLFDFLGVDGGDYDAAFKLLDTDGQGLVEFRRFTRALLTRASSVNVSVDRVLELLLAEHATFAKWRHSRIQEIFNKVDTTHRGSLILSEFKRGMLMGGCTLSVRKLEQTFREIVVKKPHRLTPAIFLSLFESMHLLALNQVHRDLSHEKKQSLVMSAVTALAEAGANKDMLDISSAPRDLVTILDVRLRSGATGGETPPTPTLPAAGVRLAASTASKMLARRAANMAGSNSGGGGGGDRRKSVNQGTHYKAIVPVRSWKDMVTTPLTAVTGTVSGTNPLAVSVLSSREARPETPSKWKLAFKREQSSWVKLELDLREMLPHFLRQEYIPLRKLMDELSTIVTDKLARDAKRTHVPGISYESRVPTLTEYTVSTYARRHDGKEGEATERALTQLVGNLVHHAETSLGACHFAHLLGLFREGNHELEVFYLRAMHELMGGKKKLPPASKDGRRWVQFQVALDAAKTLFDGEDPSILSRVRTHVENMAVAVKRVDDRDVEESKVVSHNMVVLYYMNVSLEKHDTDLRHMFAQFDLDNNGRVSLAEFLTGMRKLETGVSDDALRRFFNYMDKDRTGDINYGELQSIMAKRLQEVKVDIDQFIDLVIHAWTALFGEARLKLAAVFDDVFESSTLALRNQLAEMRALTSRGRAEVQPLQEVLDQQGFHMALGALNKSLPDADLEAIFPTEEYTVGRIDFVRICFKYGLCYQGANAQLLRSEGKRRRGTHVPGNAAQAPSGGARKVANAARKLRSLTVSK